MTIPVILDCDPGHDDAIALLLALASPELHVLGVTTVHGNQTLEKTTANALRVLDLVGRPDVPVAAGADRPLSRELTVASHVHGDSGLDGPTLPPAERAPLGEHAVDFMVRTIAEAVTLVPTGPLTNIALLLERTGGANVERIVLMGGAAAEGNMTPAAEFNIWADPEAAQTVFHAGIDTTMIGLDVTHRAVTTPAVQNRLRETGTIGSFVADLIDFFAVYHLETYGWDGAPIHDAVAVAHVVAPDLVTTIESNVEIELESELCRGRTVVDRWKRTGRPVNAHVGLDLDRDGFFDLLVERIGRLGSPMADVVVFVEVPSGSRNKYELDPELGGIALDRRLFTSMSYPADYGFVEGTMGEDGDPLDALVLVGEPTFPGCRIRVRVVGVFHMTDEKGPDEKVICVPLKDPAWMRVSDIHDIPSEFRDEIEHFFQVYKDLEEGKTETRGYGNRADAERIIQEARDRAGEDA